MKNNKYTYLVLEFVASDYQLEFDKDSDIQRLYLITVDKELIEAVFRLSMSEITGQDQNKSKRGIEGKNRSSSIYKDLLMIKSYSNKIFNVYKFDNMPYSKKSDIQDRIMKRLIDENKTISDFAYNDLFYISETYADVGESDI